MKKNIIILLLLTLSLMSAIALINPTVDEYAAWLQENLISKTSNPILCTIISIYGLDNIKVNTLKTNYLFCSSYDTTYYDKKLKFIGFANYYFSNDISGINLDAWNFNEIKKILPNEDQRYQNISVDNDYIVYTYDKGVLKLFVSPYSLEVFAIMFDHEKLKNDYTMNVNESDYVYVQKIKNYTVICRRDSLNEDIFNILKSKHTTLTTISYYLEKPTYIVQMREYGPYKYTYFEYGLTFISCDSQNMNLFLYPYNASKEIPYIHDGFENELLDFNKGLTYEDYKEMQKNTYVEFAASLFEDISEENRAMLEDKKSFNLESVSENQKPIS